MTSKLTTFATTNYYQNGDYMWDMKESASKV